MRFVIDTRLRGSVMTGAGRYLAGLVPALAECAPRDELVLLVRKECIGLWEGIPDNVYLKEVDFPPAGLKQHFMMRNILKGIAPDVFHYPMFDLPHGLGVPSVITVHDLNAMLFPGYFTRGRWWRRPAAALLHASAVFRAAHVLTVSEATRDELVRVFPFAKRKVTAVHHGYGRIPVMERSEKMENLRNHYGLKDGYLIYVGVHRPHKNLEGLIRAIASLREGCAKVLLVAVGELDQRFNGPLVEVEKLGLREVVKFIGYVSGEELMALYRGAMAFVFPSFQEGFGLPLLEAMDFGVPVACSDIPVHREVAGDAAIYFNPHSPQDIANALQKLLNDDKLRRSLAERGREHIKLFHWKNCAAATLDVYRQVASRNKGWSVG